MGLFSRKCGTHDKASPMKTAELERATGIDPDAVERLIADPASYSDAVATFTDPDLIDCGNKRCRKER